jgi:hypothetical protein
MGDEKISVFSKPQVKDFNFCFNHLSWHIGSCSIWSRGVKMKLFENWLRPPVCGTAQILHNKTSYYPRTNHSQLPVIEEIIVMGWISNQLNQV